MTIEDKRKLLALARTWSDMSDSCRIWGQCSNHPKQAEFLAKANTYEDCADQLRRALGRDYDT